MNYYPDPDRLAQIVAESAQQIWLAGLSALSMAEKDSGKFFESLSKLCDNIQSHTLKTAGMARKTVAGGKNAATDTWDRFEELFELRVGRALNALQIPTARDIKELTARVDKLSDSVDKLRAEEAAGKQPAASRKKRKPTRKTARKNTKKKTAAKKKTARKKSKNEVQSPKKRSRK